MAYKLHRLFLPPIMAIITMQDNHSKEVNRSLPYLTQSSNKATLVNTWSHPLNKEQGSQCKHLVSPYPRVSMVKSIIRHPVLPHLCMQTHNQAALIHSSSLISHSFSTVISSRRLFRAFVSAIQKVTVINSSLIRGTQMLARLC